MIFRGKGVRLLLCVVLGGAVFVGSPARTPLHAEGSAGPPAPEDSILNEQGVENLKCGDYKKAGSLFTEAIKINPGVKFYYNNLAVSQIKLKDYSAAYQSLRKAVDMDPRYVKALSNLSLTCFYLSKFKEAFLYYMRARKADSAYVDERFERSKVKRKVEEISRENPENGDYKKILERLRSEEQSLSVQPR